MVGTKGFVSINKNTTLLRDTKENIETPKHLDTAYRNSVRDYKYFIYPHKHEYNV